MAQNYNTEISFQAHSYWKFARGRHISALILHIYQISVVFRIHMNKKLYVVKISRAKLKPE